MVISITEVEEYLKDVKEAITRGQYQIDINPRRPDNRALFTKYVLKEAQARDILNLSSFEQSRNTQKGER